MLSTCARKAKCISPHTELAMKTLRHWLRNTRRSVELKRRLENLLEAKRQATLETAFAKWRDASLRGLEKEVVSMREARVLTVAWELWVKRTRVGEVPTFLILVPALTVYDCYPVLNADSSRHSIRQNKHSSKVPEGLA